MCLVGVSPTGGGVLTDVSFSGSDGVGVFGWDSVVVEGWAACVRVCFIDVFCYKIGNFGELILSKIALPGDL